MKETISVEGASLSSALILASEKLGVAPNLIDYSFDKEHFRTASGRNRGVETIKINAWPADPNKTKGAEAAQTWIAKLTELIGVETAVSYRMLGDKSAEIILKSEKGGRLVGRNGSSLKAINTMFLAAMKEEFSEWNYRLEVSGKRKPADDNRREKRGKLNNKDVKELERLANLLANKVLRSKKPLVMRQNLNSFERRVIHLTIQSLEGVATESVMEKGVKKIKIMPAESE